MTRPRASVLSSRPTCGADFPLSDSARPSSADFFPVSHLRRISSNVRRNDLISMCHVQTNRAQRRVRCAGNREPEGSREKLVECQGRPQSNTLLRTGVQSTRTRRKVYTRRNRYNTPGENGSSANQRILPHLSPKADQMRQGPARMSVLYSLWPQMRRL